jgi:demethylmenaquinone methyltransferase/2-methoxy-6-polyprenyl-1,4-benzoquinol methylase
MKDPNHGQRVQQMFTQIAPRYDLMNRIMTGGQDVRWRQEVVRRARLFPGARLLDLGAGTGDLTREALRQQPDCLPVAGDFTLAMMRRGRRPSDPARLTWTAADALALPFATASFDALVSGFLLRNVADLPAALREQRRVLRPGGRWVSLDTTIPATSILSPFIRIYLNLVIPTLGKLLTGQAAAYRYLPDSTQHFLEPETLAVRIAQAGFQQVGFQRLMFGTVAIHWAIAPADEEAGPAATAPAQGR